MGRNIAIGIQDFGDLIQKKYFYIDKTSFLKEWWEKGDSVTLITRPRRFGKTLNMSMTEQFFSMDYAGRGDLFEGLFIWREEKCRKLQGTYPVISLSFANVKEVNYVNTRERICQLLTNKTNPWLERGLMTGITRVSKESIFSDLNNLEVVTTTSDRYATSFGFTEQEVFQALTECGLEQEKEKVKQWYDGFIFGKYKDIYNPWSILNFLDKKSLQRIGQTPVPIAWWVSSFGKETAESRRSSRYFCREE